MCLSLVIFFFFCEFCEFWYQRWGGAASVEEVVWVGEGRGGAACVER